MSGAGLLAPLLDAAAPEIHVWYCDLAQPAGDLGGLLDPAERERAARFRFERDRQPWIAARAALRRILGAYLGLDPRLVRFALGPQGKPGLDPALHPEPLHFNLSHSHQLMALALAGRPVGVDVERERFELDHAGLAAGAFSPTERAALAALPADERPRAFFRIWARKEAFIKALGAGLSQPLDSFDVSLEEGVAALLATRPDPAAAAGWALAALRPGPGYAGALAVAAGDLAGGWRLVERRWPPGGERPDGI
ncbi:MAG TPA: 4'-phosphopantetheinyl transferase superfamily protein [Herpetosiphonaceae bacterium]